MLFGGAAFMGREPEMAAIFGKFGTEDFPFSCRERLRFSAIFARESHAIEMGKARNLALKKHIVIVEPTECRSAWADHPGLVVLGGTDEQADEKAERLGAGAGVLVGGPQRVAEGIRAFAELGAAWVILGPIDSSDPENATRLGELVIPALGGS